MTPRELIEAFETLADAPDGVKRLRELVLQLAVRGKLVPQDPVDEPASALLLRVFLQYPEQSRHASNGNPVVHEENPYEIPPSWEWVQFCDIFQCRLGKMLDAAKNRGEPHPYLRNINVRWGTFDLSDVAEMRLEPHEVTSVSVRKGDLVICEGGEPGRAAVWELDQEFVVQKALHRARPCLVNSRYYQFHLRVDCASGRIAPLFTGATIKHLTGQALSRHMVTLPPLAEQCRIVARVDDLMGLLDQLEAARAVRDEVRHAARGAALAALHSADDPGAVKIEWGRISPRMGVFFDAPEDVGALREEILELAVSGKLVRQDPSEEPTELLLAQLGSLLTGRRKTKHDPVESKELGFSLPTGWSASRVGSLVAHADAGWSPKCETFPTSTVEQWGVLKTTAVQANRYMEEHHKVLPPGLVPRPELEVEVGDLLVTRAGPSSRVGVAAYVTRTRARLMLSDKIIRCRFPSALINGAWLAMAINHGPGARFLKAKQTGMDAAQMNISQERLLRTPIPVPPLGEQHRIVAKVDALMALCDDLDVHLNSARELQAQFAAAAVNYLDV